MLIELRIRNFAVLDDATLELRPGLNVLSGETGAGKSIVVGALSLLMGERASSEVVRDGARRASVEGVFDVSGSPSTLEAMEGLGIEPEDGLLILKREVAAEGRNRAWVNGSPTTATVVGRLGGALVDLHGQHEHQTLLRPAAQRRILDAYGGATSLAETVARLYRDLEDAQDRLDARIARSRELEGQADFLRYQLDELDGADPAEGEDVSLEAEASRLEHSEELIRDASTIHDALYGGDRDIAGSLAELQKALERMTRFDPGLEADARALDEAYHHIAEVGRKLGDYASSIEHDAGRLERIRSRLDQLFRLKRKYGPELTQVLETRARLRAELSELERSTLDLGELERDRDRARAALVAQAAALTTVRREAGERLADQVRALLPDLGMPGATFEVELRPLDEPGAGGGETVHFRASLNPGFEPSPLSRIASGGELSRVMLALKALLAEVDSVPTLVFDEIDAGIGGVVATRVAAKLREVACAHQVLVVTHLPQLAARAHTHFQVRKDVEALQAVTDVAELEGERRVTEIARMLGGDPESRTSREHARELLEAGRV
jgi:DNA repair protein RecN (Recombination protein N)